MIVNPSKTIVELSEADAILFVQFQKRYAMVKLLESLGAFDIQNGDLSIHFDHLGRITGVDVRKHYRPNLQ